MHQYCYIHLGFAFHCEAIQPICIGLYTVSINVFLMQCSKCEMSDKRLICLRIAKPPPYKKVRNEPEDIESEVIEANGIFQQNAAMW